MVAATAMSRRAWRSLSFPPSPRPHDRFTARRASLTGERRGRALPISTRQHGLEDGRASRGWKPGKREGSEQRPRQTAVPDDRADGREHDERDEVRGERERTWSARPTTKAGVTATPPVSASSCSCRAKATGGRSANAQKGHAERAAATERLFPAVARPTTRTAPQTARQVRRWAAPWAGATAAWAWVWWWTWPVPKAKSE